MSPKRDVRWTPLRWEHAAFVSCFNAYAYHVAICSASAWSAAQRERGGTREQGREQEERRDERGRVGTREQGREQEERRDEREGT